MAEAGEVVHWEVLEQLGKRAGDGETVELVGWALPIQRRHLEEARDTAGSLAAEEDPAEAA
jgi:hypothetical protein